MSSLAMHSMFLFNNIFSFEGLKKCPLIIVQGGKNRTKKG